MKKIRELLWLCFGCSMIVFVSGQDVTEVPNKGMKYNPQQGFHVQKEDDSTSVIGPLLDSEWRNFLISQPLKDEFGAIIRGDTGQKNLYLTFTAHEFDDGYEKIKKVLQVRQIKASFFVTGQYAKQNRERIHDLVKEGHYIGPHSHDHLLYADWETRKTLVSRRKFKKDLRRNLRQLQKAGVDHPIGIFMPPYEWYNQDIVDWSAEMGLQVVDFTPGIRTAADYTFPEMEERYVHSDEILRGVYEKEEDEGLNGYVILIHMGTDPRRADKLYNHLDGLIRSLSEKGYQFCRIDLIQQKN